MGEDGAKEGRVGKCWVAWSSILSRSRTYNEKSRGESCRIANMIPVQMAVFLQLALAASWIQSFVTCKPQNPASWGLYPHWKGCLQHFEEQWVHSNENRLLRLGDTSLDPISKFNKEKMRKELDIRTFRIPRSNMSDFPEGTC